LTEFRGLVAVQLHRSQAHVLYGVANCVYGLVDEDADLFYSGRKFRDDLLRRIMRDVTRTLGMEDEAQRIRARFGWQRARHRGS
jgi:hypothetical protein